MTQDAWEPFGLTDDERDQFVVLKDGAPPLLREALLPWIGARLTAGGDFHNRVAVIQMQNAVGVDLGVVAGGTLVPAREVLGSLRKLEDMAFLRTLDYLLGYRTAGSFDSVEATLQAARSKWTVGKRGGRTGLVERVPAGVQQSVETTIETAGAPGLLLARAWSDVHGLTPQDSSAYAFAVRAVESAAVAVVQPNHKGATLGTVLGQMRSDGDWRLPLREHKDASSSDLVLAMLGTLWVGHRDRHGSPDYSDVTHEEARAAVVLAATLVDWFAAGAVQRRV